MIIAPLFGAAAVKLRLWHDTAANAERYVMGAGARPHVHTGVGQSLATSLTFLLFGMILVGDSRVELVDHQALALRQWLEVERGQVLEAVHAKAVGLPTAAEAQVAERIQTMRWENRRLVADLDRLKAQYADQTRRHSAKIAELQASVDQAWVEIRRLQDERAVLQGKLATVMADRQLPPAPDPLAHRSSDVSAIGAEVRSDNGRFGSSFGQLAASPVDIAAWQIADGLEKTRKEAMLSNQEQTFTVDVVRRLVSTGSSGELAALDPGLDLRLYTAKAELVDESRGLIRFFPDGRATGGRIDLKLEGHRAAVKVHWSDGSVTVDAVQQ